jgi:tetrapyrrole methylase family protein/MazG family protein
MPSRVTIVGLGPAGLDRLAPAAVALLDDPESTVIVRTLHHPAAAELAERRDVESCDSLYDDAADLDTVYERIVERVVAAAADGRVVYAVPGSAVVGERAAAQLRLRGADGRLDVVVLPGESFLDLLYERTGLDPITSGLQILDGRDLPDPLPLHLPTVITQVDGALVAGDVAVALGRVLPDTTPVVVLDALGSPDERVESVPLSGLMTTAAGPRTTLFVDPQRVGWHGLVVTNRLLRSECPWDREQTHHSLVSHLIEEAYETVEAVTALNPEAPGGDVDFGAYAEVEEELGDLLLQVVFHATLAEEIGAFSVEEVAEGIRRKLVHRHPHVFGDVAADTADEVRANWETIKSGEKRRASLMDDIPAALPGIARADKAQRRAASVGFDWSEAAPVLEKIEEEVEELAAALGGGEAGGAVHHEIGDVLFSVVNLCRHVGVDPELALRAATDRFMDRFRIVERLAGDQLSTMTLDELDALWNQAKAP